MSTTLLILLNLTMSLLAFGAVAGGLIIARNLSPGPRHRWDLAFRRRPTRRHGAGVAYHTARPLPRRSDPIHVR